MFDHLRCVEGTVGRELSTQVLEDEICTEAAHMAVSECHFVLLAAELDRRGEWAGQGLRSMAHWLNWRCGTSLMAAREQVRVGRALNKLPVLRTAFASGELSYSKARAITRAATPETEEALVEVARYTTASQLEAIMREYRKASPDERKEALQRHQDLRYVRSWTDDDGMTVIQARLSPEDAAVVLAAIEAAREASWQASRRKDSAADVPAGTSATVDAGTTANPEPNVPAGTSWDPETSWDEETGSEGSSSSLAFEAQIEEFEQSRADALVNVCEAVLANGLPTEGTTGPPITVLLHIDEEVLKDPTSEGCSFLDGGGTISSHTARRLACSSAVHTLLYRIDGTVDPTGSTRSVPRRLRRAVLARDRGCRFPGCTQRRFVDVHHVVFWSEGGPTVASNLTTLCRVHHRLVHEGGFHLEMDAGCHVRVWAPNGVEVMACPPLSALSLPRPEEQHRSAGLDLGPATLAYGGESCDLSYVTDVLLEAAYGKD